MFTGLVEEIGQLIGRFKVRKDNGAPTSQLHGGNGGGHSRECGVLLQFRSQLGPLSLGESIAVDGVCLTVERILSGGFEAVASPETLRRTSLGGLPVGASVHLERATPLGGRMGGHIVTGHVDTVGTLVGLGSRGEAREVTVGFPQEYSHLIAEKGSVTLDGVSLTVNTVGQDSFSVLLVPHTRKSTKFDQLAVGARVNIEVDILARYVARQLAAAVGKPVPRTTGEERWESLLSRHGYM